MLMIFVEIFYASLFTATLCVRSRVAAVASAVDDGNARSASQCDPYSSGLILVLKRFCIGVEVF